MGIWPHTIKEWKNLWSPLQIGVSGAGRFTLAGTIKNSRGIDFGKKRVFGQWAFVLLVEGQGRYVDALGSDREIHAGDWILVFPEIAHSYGPVGGAVWNEFFICFDGPMFDQWRESQVLSPQRPVGHLGSADQAWAGLSAVLADVLVKPPSAQEALARWLLFLLKTCGREAADLTEGQEPRLRKACRLIEERSFRADFDWGEVCREAGVGYENLRKLFRRELGTTPSQYREQRRIEKAMLLARTQHYPAKKIADLLGYHDEAHFSRAFRRGCGESFTRYKQRFLR